ncbi:MAG: hypothetical protein IT329_13405, partial [Caldilineaceae bacterium]|nr:hypothetical protein [Caldilineaceae bacterium]
METMWYRERWMRVLLVMALLVLGGSILIGCTKAVESAAGEKPAVIEPIEGTELNRVILTEKAAQRLDIQTTVVREETVDGTPRLVVPYAAVIYDLNGGTWLYASPETLTFVRTPITVDHIEGDIAVLTEGPPVGTEVAT